MDEIVAIEINREDWLSTTASSLFYPRDLRRLQAHDAVQYCWSKLEIDPKVAELFSRYVTEYSFHLSEIIDSFDPSDLDIELLDDVFDAICIEIFGRKYVKLDYYDFNALKIGIEGLHHYLVNDHNIYEIMDRDVMSLWKTDDQLYIGIGTRD